MKLKILFSSDLRVNFSKVSLPFLLILLLLALVSPGVVLAQCPGTPTDCGTYTCGTCPAGSNCGFDCNQCCCSNGCTCECIGCDPCTESCGSSCPSVCCGGGGDTHNECNSSCQCVEVSGSGSDECSGNSDCYPCGTCIPCNCGTDETASTGADFFAQASPESSGGSLPGLVLASTDRGAALEEGFPVRLTSYWIRLISWAKEIFVGLRSA